MPPARKSTRTSAETERKKASSTSASSADRTKSRDLTSKYTSSSQKTVGGKKRSDSFLKSVDAEAQRARKEARLRDMSKAKLRAEPIEKSRSTSQGLAVEEKDKDEEVVITSQISVNFNDTETPNFTDPDTDVLVQSTEIDTDTFSLHTPLLSSSLSKLSEKSHVPTPPKKPYRAYEVPECIAKKWPVAAEYVREYNERKRREAKMWDEYKAKMGRSGD